MPLPAVQQSPDAAEAPSPAVAPSAPRWRFWFLCTSLFLTMFMYGFCDNARSIAFPMIKRYYNASNSNQGVLMMGGAGYPVGAFLGMHLSRRLGWKSCLLSGGTLMSLGCLLLSQLPSYWWLLAGLQTLSLSMGLTEIGVTVVSLHAFRERPAQRISLVQFFYGLGSICIPYAAVAFVHWTKRDYKGIYLGVLPGTLLALLLTTFAHADAPSDTSATPPSQLSVLGVLRRYEVWLFVLTLAVVEILVFGTTDWSATYFQDVYGLDATVEGALFETIFLVSYTLSRLVNGAVAEWMGYYRFLTLSYGLCTLWMILGFVLGARGLYVLPLTGFFFGASWPVIMGLCLRRFGSDAPAITSIIIVVGCGLNVLSQLLIGLVNQSIGSEWGYRLLTICPAVVVLLLWLLRRQEAKADGGLLAPLLPRKEEA